MRLPRPLLLSLALLAVLAPRAAAQRNYLEETAAEKDARMDWWRDARFGMFIHWGLYAVPAGTYQGERIAGIGEWIMQRAKIPIPEYEQYAKRFDPEKFDAQAWVDLARDAGMKYIVITSKHHDGFNLFDSKASDYDIVDRTPFHRDPLAELAAAAKKDGVRLGFYHSIMDWHHPDAQAPNYPEYNSNSKTNPNFDRYVEGYLKPELKQLVTQYDPAVLWFDGEWIPDWTEARGRDLYQYVRSLKPDIIINNRVGKGRQGMQGFSRNQSVGDFGTPEQRVPPQGLPGVDWESCMTMNDTWGFKTYDDDWKDTRTLVRTLVDAASKGGNFLLNIGPKADGTIPEPIVARLREMGAWMRENGESIYGTTASPFPAQPAWGRYTRKGETLYAHVFEWPKDGKLTLGDGVAPSKAYLLADRAALQVERTADGAVVHLPAVAPSTIDAVLVLEGGAPAAPAAPAGAR